MERDRTGKAGRGKGKVTANGSGSGNGEDGETQGQSSNTRDEECDGSSTVMSRMNGMMNKEEVGRVSC